VENRFQSLPFKCSSRRYSAVHPMTIIQGYREACTVAKAALESIAMNNATVGREIQVKSSL
jgi:chaperonin GroEL (HSP60 family)